MLSTISTVNLYLCRTNKPVVIIIPPQGKYPIHSKAVLSTSGSFTSTTNTGGFVQYTNSNTSSFIYLNSLSTSNSYFDSKSFTMYYAYKTNLFTQNAGILGFYGTIGSNNGFLFHMTMQSTTALAFDWQDNGNEYGTNTGPNQNYPSFPYAVGSTYHMFFTFDKPTQKFNMYIFNSSGTSIFTFLNKPYPTNVFSSGAGVGKAFSSFRIGANAYADNYAARQTVVFFNFYEKILSSTEISNIIADSS
jgi:hypothetical protein